MQHRNQRPTLLSQLLYRLSQAHKAFVFLVKLKTVLHKQKPLSNRKTITTSSFRRPIAHIHAILTCKGNGRKQKKALQRPLNLISDSISY
jgi:hypothetical protein